MHTEPPSATGLLRRKLTARCNTACCLVMLYFQPCYMVHHVPLQSSIFHYFSYRWGKQISKRHRDVKPVINKQQLKVITRNVSYYKFIKTQPNNYPCITLLTFRSLSVVRRSLIETETSTMNQMNLFVDVTRRREINTNGFGHALQL